MTKKIIGIAVALLVIAISVPTLNAQTVLLDEDFNGSWGTYANNPPAGWTINYTGSASNNDWNRYSRGGSYCARMYWSPSENGVDELISPVIDCSAYGEVWLAVDHYYDHYSGSYTAQWLGSDDGGSSFPHVIWDYNQSDYGSYPFTRDSIDISSWAANQDDAHVNFYGNGYTWNMNWWYVDNVMVYGFAGGGPGEDSLDLEMVQIVRPKDEEEGGVAFRPACKIYNNLDEEVIAKVTCKIKKKTGGGYIYEDALNSVPFPPGYTEVNAFGYFTPEGGVAYNVLFVVEHPDDIDNSNNDMDKNFSAAVGAQVDATEILAPAGDDQNGGFDPSANFTEMLGAEGTGAEGVMLRCKIEDAAFHSVVYLDSVGPEDFDPDEVYLAAFPNVGNEVLVDGSPYTITFWATMRDDPIGDEASSTFNYYEGIVETPVLETYTLDVVGATVNFNIGTATDVSLRIYDAAGNLVTTLASGHHSAGSYSVSWDGNAASGVYFVKMITPDFSATSKLMLLR